MEKSTSSTSPITAIFSKKESEEFPPLQTQTTPVKPHTQRRRASLFEPQIRANDFGNSSLVHADFPRRRSNSLTSLRPVDKREKFEKQRAHRIVQQVLSRELERFKSYNDKACGDASRKIAFIVKDRVCSAFDLSGCKVICLCYITKRAKPSLAIDSGCAWNELKSTMDNDAFVDCVYKNSDIMSVVSVYVIHCPRVEMKTSVMGLFQEPKIPFRSKARSRTISLPVTGSRDGGIFMPPLQRRDDWKN